ncbi:MAG: magnesium transporter CorA family protein [Chloroflexi bacterium]|nr:magnesium transporter CorA family protein [Chloroflexota bacterium]
MAVVQPTREKQPAQMNLWKVTWGDLTWTYIERPTPREIDILAKEYTYFHPLNLEDCLSRIQRPKIDEYDEHLFTVLHFPVFDKQARISLPSEVDIFVGKNFLVTVHCGGDLKPLAKLFKECQLDEQLRRKYMEKGSGYLFYQVIDRLVDAIFPMLDKINDNIESLQDAVISKPVPQTAQGILVLRRDIISLRRIIRPQIDVIDGLERNLENQKYPFLDEDLGVYFGDIGDHLHKIRGTLEDHREIVDSLSDTSNWLTSHRIQEIMRVLTIFIAVLMPVELLSTVAGSNTIPASWVNNTNVFIGTVILQVAVVAGMLYFFRHRRWI